ncbi:terminase large subunit [Variovorax boronicumulans]|uniref:terminase large subunit n=1 Tax=Variovorax boronicumulans TaxID=436515 RepID=UPI001C564019
MAEWSTACPDWAARLRARRSIIPAPIFAAPAAEALAIFRELRIVDAPGSPTFGESCEQFVFDFVAAIFGAYDVETGRRLIREALMLIPKKNSKSTLAAGIMLTALILNWRVSAEMIILAPTVEIANNAYAPARDMIKADEELIDLFHVQDHVRTITHRVMGSTLKVVAADSDTVGGKKASWVLIDEEWIFGKRINSEAMFREAAGGLASRPEGMVIKLSTQSDEPPAGIFRQDLQYARDVRDGKIEDKAFLPVLYEHPPEMVASGEHLKLENLPMVNPNYGVSVDEEYLEREFKKASLAGVESIRGFLAKHGNVEIGVNLRSDRWAGAEFWEAQGAPGMTLEQLLNECEVVDVGIDGGGLDDLLGLAVAGRRRQAEEFEVPAHIDEDTKEFIPARTVIKKRWMLWTRAFAHPSVLERRKDIAPRLMDFAKTGDLVLVKAMGDDVQGVATLVKRCEASGLLDKVGCDPAGIGAILDALVEAKIPQEKVIGISQGWKMTGAIKTTERKLAEHVLIHAGQPLMNWCVGNAKVTPSGNAVVITKQASGTAKIDPLMASFNAVTLLSLNPEARGNSVYESRGIRFL